MNTQLGRIVAGLVGLAIIAGLVIVFANQNPPAEGQAVVQNITPQQYQSEFANAPHFLLDVRTVEEFNSGHISNAANISLQTLATRLAEVPQDQPIVVYCRSGNRSAQAAQILRDAGYTEIYDLGGILAWQSAGLPVE
ncbi:MAG: rhodanese-like domain-containing protein [Phototrophicaceae bacterium]|jgi:rhodanese-related sulfurtransferase